MYVYFVGSVAVLKNMRAMYKRIVDVFEKGGHHIFYDHILSDEPIEPSDAELFFAYFKQRINSSDLMVVEISYPTTVIKYEIAYALEKKKPIIAFSLKETSADIIPILTGAPSDSVFLYKYSEGNLENVVSKSFADVSQSIGKSFTFTMTPGIGNYLEWKSRQKGVPRSTYLRSLVEGEMRRDKKYKLVS